MKNILPITLTIALLPGTAFPQTFCAIPAVKISHSTASPNTNPNQLVFIDTTKYPEALCNDGSPAAFIIRQGTGLSANRWVIDLPGGGACETAQTCLLVNQQTPDLDGTEGLGTPGHPDQAAVDEIMGSSSSIDPGIMSPYSANNPDFWDATMVEVAYCSQDYDIGNRPAVGKFSAAKIKTWGFNGRAILAAVIGTLNEDQYGLADAKEILFAGSSAGAVGVFMNLNNTALAFPSAARFVAAADAGFADNAYPEFDSASKTSPYLATTTPTTMEAVATQGASLWNAVGNPNCNAKATTQAERLQCLSPAYVMDNGYVQVPTFILQSNYDTIQLETNGIATCEITVSCSPANPDQAKADSYMTAFAAQLLNQMQNASKLSPTSAFAVESVAHTLIDGDPMTGSEFTASFDLSSNNQAVTPAGELGTWYRKPCTVPASQRVVTTVTNVAF